MLVIVEQILQTLYVVGGNLLVLTLIVYINAEVFDGVVCFKEN